MRLYAIRDNQTRQVYNLDEFLDLYDGAVIKVNHTRPYSSKRKHRILVEPSEPCVSCDEFAMIVLNTRLPHERWNFCPMCGRSLT